MKTVTHRNGTEVEVTEKVAKRLAGHPILSKSYIVPKQPTKKTEPVGVVDPDEAKDSSDKGESTEK